MNRILAVAITCVGLALVVPTPAKASPADDLVHNAAVICGALDVDSSPANIEYGMGEFYRKGIPTEIAVATWQYAISQVCPEYLDELQLWAVIYEVRHA